MAVQWKDYDIVGSYNNQRVTPLDGERSVNCFEYIDPRGKKPKSLINTSGLINTNSDYGTLVTGGFRAQFAFNGFTYAVIGNHFVRQDANNIVSVLGMLQNTSTGYVGIDANTFQIMFVDGINGYIFDTLANTFAMITDSSFPANPIDVCTLDNFFIVAQGNTPNFQMSQYDQGLVWGPAANNFTANSATSILTITGSTLTPAGPSGTPNYQTGVQVTVSNSGGALPMPLSSSDTYYVIQIDGTTIKLADSYANAIAGINIVLTTNGTGTQTITSVGQLQQGSITTHPGNIVACRTLHRRLFLFSSFYTEVWENAGIGTNLPIRRNNSLLMEYGTPAIGSISVSFDVMCFLSQTRDGLGPVMQVRGTQAIPISNHALDFQLAQYASQTIPATNPPQTQVSDCRAFLILENGLIFYRMNFTAANHTYVYNVTLSNPEREDGKLWHEEEVLNGDRHPAQTHSYFNGRNLVGNYLSPILYQVDPNTVTNDLQPIKRMRIPRPFVVETYQRIRCDRLHVDMLQGQLNYSPAIVGSLFLTTETGNIIDTEAGLDIETEETVVNLELNQPPWMFLSLSKDGGQTYGYVRREPMGRVGNRSFRTVWRKLGTTPRGQAFQPKFEFYSQTPFVILGAAWVFEVMPE